MDIAPVPGPGRPLAAATAPMIITYGDIALWLLFAGTALLAIGFILGELEAHYHDDHKKGHR